MQDIEVSDSDSWWYAHGEQRQGPVSGRELKRLAASGALQQDALLWRDGLPDWIEAAGVRGLPKPSAATEPAGLTEPPWFPVTTPKLLLMSLCTLGLYQVYWLYQHWQCVRQRERSDIMPFWRAVFGLFFVHALYARINDSARNAGLPPNGHANALAALWIVLGLLWKLPEPWTLLGFLAPLALVPMQQLASRINTTRVPEHDRNGRYSLANRLALGFGGLLVLMTVMGTFMLAEEGEEDRPKRRPGRSSPVAWLGQPPDMPPGFVFATPA